jgi:glycosyltransferase involved in cell wall biosynthesis
MSAPLVSVKMITYNHAPYIAQAIEGVLRQRTDFPFELVIGEDCSTDGTRDIVFDYQKRHPDVIRVVTSERNVGMKQNSYRTGRACRGKYIAFCEGDDYWHHPLKLQKQVYHIDSHPECGLVFSDYDVYDAASQRTIYCYNRHIRPNMPRSPGLVDIVSGRGGILAGLLTCTIMVRRELVVQVIEADAYLHKEAHFLMGDTQLWAEVSCLKQINYLDESLVTHNLLVESASRSRDICRRLRFSVSGSEMLLYLCDKYDLPKQIRAVHERNWRADALRLAFHERDAKLAGEVRDRGGPLRFREWLKYLGARNAALHCLVKPLVGLRLRYLVTHDDFWFRDLH